MMWAACLSGDQWPEKYWIWTLMFYVKFTPAAAFLLIWGYWSGIGLQSEGCCLLDILIP